MPLWARVGAFAIGIAVFLGVRHNLGAGLLAGMAALVAMQWVFGA